MKPKVSIIVPNYNHEAFLKERIDSILTQTFTDYELIILDDYSNDNSRDIINIYRGHPKVSNMHFNEKNSGGTFKQWDKGLQLASGDLIWIAESDDLADPSFLEEAVRTLDKDEKIGLYECRSFWINSEGNKLNESSAQIDATQIDGKTFIIENMLLGNSIHNASALVFRKALVQLPLIKEIIELKYCGDWLFWTLLLSKSNIHISEHYHNYFRRHYGSVSNNADKNGLQFLEGIKVYGFIRSLFRSEFVNPIRTSDRTWASSILHSSLNKRIIKDFLKESLKINPFINILYRYYKLKKQSDNWFSFLIKCI
ncbi:glycosyltransferase involved in cell wall biosynthesis [Flavobacterium sp. W4I14]|nr:glycosyltransferase involved in cell wall biosynthesis [Flavobacterium sp. W4I14]